MNKEAGQNTKPLRRNNYWEDLDPEKLDWLKWFSHNWKWYFAVNRISDQKSTQRHHQESEGEHASGNREALTHTSDNGGKQSGGTGPGGRDHNGHGVVKSEGFFPFSTQDFAPT